MKCKNCGALIPDGNVFCTKCGTPVSINKEASEKTIKVESRDITEPIVEKSEIVEEKRTANKKSKVPLIVVICIFLLALSGACVFFFLNFPQMSYDKAIEQAKTDLEAGNYNEAIREFKELKKIDVKDNNYKEYLMDAYLVYAEKLLNNEDYDEAILMISELESLDKKEAKKNEIDDLRIRINLAQGKKALNENSLQEAEHLLLEVLNKKPEETDAYLGMCSIRLSSGDVDGALSMIESGISSGADQALLLAKQKEIAEHIYIKECLGERSDGGWERSEYNENGKRIYYENYTNYWSKNTYNSNGDVQTEENSKGSLINYRYDINGRLEYKDDNGVVSKWTYDELNRPLYIVRSDDYSGRYTYNDDGTSTYYAEKPAEKYVEFFMYDQEGRCILEQYASPGKNNWIKYQYDEKGNLIDEEWPEDDQISYHRQYSYDEDGNRVSMSEVATGLWERYTYDFAGNMVTREKSDGLTYKYSYKYGYRE